MDNSSLCLTETSKSIAHGLATLAGKLKHQMKFHPVPKTIVSSSAFHNQILKNKTQIYTGKTAKMQFRP
jgi:hypothetical protein